MVSTFNNHHVPRDAQPTPYPPPGAPRIEPRTTRVRIRIAGTWYDGHIQRWSRLPDGTWAAWLSYQTDPEHPTIAPAWGWYAFDPEAIVPASTDDPQ